MKRLALALCAGLLLPLGMMAGSALADHTGLTLDQSWTTATTNQGGDTTLLAQTFTAGITGPLTEVDLWMTGGTPISYVRLESTLSGKPTGTTLATSGSGTPVGGNGGWVPFTFSSPYSEASGTTYAIVFETGVGNFVLGSTGGGSTSQEALAEYNESWTEPVSDITDFEFQTWVGAAAAPDSVTTTLTWDKPSVTAGVSTPLTLTEKITYVNGTSTASYYATWDGLPTWFSPSGITCPAQVSTISCSVHQFELGLTYASSSAGATLTFTITGVAQPAASDVGTPGVATGKACLNYGGGPDVVNPDQTEQLCGEGTASVAVLAAPSTPTPTPTAAPTSTPPPTSTDNNGSSSNSTPLFALLICLAFGGLGLAAVETQRRRIGS
jgi:hypothetical protein